MWNQFSWLQLTFKKNGLKQIISECITCIKGEYLWNLSVCLSVYLPPSLPTYVCVCMCICILGFYFWYKMFLKGATLKNNLENSALDHAFKFCSQIYYSLTKFCLLDLSVSDRNAWKILHSDYRFGHFPVILFCFIYFETTFLEAYKFVIPISSW